MGSYVPSTLSGFAHLCIAGSVIGVICATPLNCVAQGKLDARYTASLAGLPIGRGAWVIDIGDDQYTAAASGMTAGVLSVFTSGQGSGASRGRIRADGFFPNTYASSITTDNKLEEMRIVLSSGTVKDVTINPPNAFNPQRVPLTEAHRHGVIDPMSAVLTRVPGNGDPLSPEACRRTIPVFDGRMRFDLHMSFKRMDVVKADKGYRGPAVVCSVQFVPIAGYVPDRPAVKYLVAQHDVEVFLAPIMGTRVLVPFKVTIPTPLGRGAIEATQFITTPTPPRLTANSPTTH
jgi:Protein of unknown function (DUF3108)